MPDIRPDARVRELLTLCIARVNAGLSSVTIEHLIGPLTPTQEDLIRDNYSASFEGAISTDPGRWGRDGAWVLKQCVRLGEIAGRSAVAGNRRQPDDREVMAAIEEVNQTACDRAGNAAVAGGTVTPAGVWCGR